MSFSTGYAFDWDVLYWIQEHMKNAFNDFLMPKLTMLGEVGAVWIIICLILLFTKKYRRGGIMLAVGLLLGVLIGNAVLKNLVARPRPCWLDENIQMLIAIPKDYSFPSGHTLSSVIAATILTKVNKKFAWFAVPLAAVIAFTRLYLFVHFPTDIIAGLVLGIIIGLFVSFVGPLMFANSNSLRGLHRLHDKGQDDR